MPRSSLLLLSALTALELIARTEAATAILNTAQVCPKGVTNDQYGGLISVPRNSTRDDRVNIPWSNSGNTLIDANLVHSEDNPAECRPLNKADKERLYRAMMAIEKEMEGVRFQEFPKTYGENFEKIVAFGECKFNANSAAVAISANSRKESIALNDQESMFAFLHRDSFLDAKLRDLMTVNYLLHELLHLLGIKHPIDQNTGQGVSSENFVIAEFTSHAHYELAEGDKKILEECFKNTPDIDKIFDVELGFSKEDFFTSVLSFHQITSVFFTYSSLVIGMGLAIIFATDRFSQQREKLKDLKRDNYEGLAEQITDAKYTKMLDCIESLLIAISPDMQNSENISERLLEILVHRGRRLYLNKLLITAGVVLVHNQLSAQTIDDYPIATTLANILFDDNAIADGKVRFRNVNTIIAAFKYIKQKFQTSEDHEHQQQTPPFDGSENTQDLEQQQATDLETYALERQAFPAESTSVYGEEGGGADNPNARRDSSVIPGVDRGFVRQRSGSTSSSSSGPEIIGRTTSELDTDDGIRPRTKVSYPSSEEVDNRDGIYTSVLL